MFPNDIRSLLDALSRIPYENLTKAISMGSQGREEAAMQDPSAVLAGHEKHGTGGTCFSLTWFVCDFLRRRGHDIYPALCDRHYGKDTHCCAVLRINGRKYALDPGYLSFAPILLSDERETRLETPFNTIVLEKSGDEVYRLNTIYLKENKYRFTLKDRPVSDQEFMAAWKGSFAQESMGYPVVTMLKDDAHLYFQKENLFVRRKEGSERIQVKKENLPETLEKVFGISREVTIKAREIFY